MKRTDTKSLLWRVRARAGGHMALGLAAFSLAGCAFVDRSGLGTADGGGGVEDEGSPADIPGGSGGAGPSSNGDPGGFDGAVAEWPGKGVIELDGGGVPADAAQDATQGDGPVEMEPEPTDGGARDADGDVPPEMEDSGTGSAPEGGDGGEPPDEDDAGPAPEESVTDLVAAIDDLFQGGETRRTLFCACPSTLLSMSCTQDAMDMDTCAMWGLKALAPERVEEVRALVTCWRPAEQAYTACIEDSLDCWNADGSTRGCTRAHKQAMDACNRNSELIAEVRQRCWE